MMIPGFDNWKLASPPESESPEPRLCERCCGEGRLYLAHACASAESYCAACAYEEECPECEGAGENCADGGEGRR